MSKGLKRLLITLISSLAVYSWFGFLLLPSVALQVINQQLDVYAKHPAHLQRLEFNPFTLELSAWSLHIGEAGDEQLSLQHLYGKLASDSLWTQTLHLNEVQLQQPTAQIIFNKEGELNLTQLFTLPANDTQPDTPKSSTSFTVLIDQLQLQQGSARFNDQRQRDPVDISFDDLNVTLNNFDTRPASNSKLQLSAHASDGAQLDWQGDLSISPLASQGHLHLRDAQLKSWWPYVHEHLNAQLTDGRLNINTRYTLESGPTLQFKASQLSAQLASVALTQHSQPLARLAKLSISDAAFDLAGQRLHIGKATSSKLEAWAEIDKNGRLNWQKLLANASADQPAAQLSVAADRVSSSSAGSSTNKNRAWHITVKQADFNQQQFNLTDHSRSEPVALDFSDFNLQIKDFDSQASSPFSLELKTNIGEQGALSSRAQVVLQPFKVDMTLDSSDLDLRPAQAWINPYAHIELRSGLFNSTLRLQISDSDNLHMVVHGDAAVSQLHMRDSLRQRDLLKWQSVAIDGIQYSLQQQALSIENITLEQPYARFIINENLTTNISELLIPQPQPAVTESANKKTERALHIGGITIKDGSANFADFSLTPNFATAIQQLNGQIGTLDNQIPSVVSVHIKGNVDRYAPVAIKGSLMPFDPLKKLDITTSFKHVELTTLTPYSGKFAGYRVQKGRLNLDLHYQINDGKLNATNQLLLEQLQLGERVDSPDAVDLPVRLAIALLKDRKGEIALSLPVQGDLNNPNFKVAPIVWQTLRNLLTRAVSAPFNFIAGLANNSASELNTVVFSPGEYGINIQSAQGLDTLTKALKDRPQLRLEIEGTSHIELDGPPLAHMRLTRAYQNAWYSILQHRGNKIDASKENLDVPDNEKPVLLEGIYRTQLKQQPPAHWAELDTDQRQQQMREAVLHSYAQSPLGLRRLAQARANSIKEYLIEQAQLNAERVYLLDVSTGKANANNDVLSMLHLGSM